VRGGEERDKLKQGLLGVGGRKRKRDGEDVEDDEDDEGQAVHQRRAMMRAKGPNPLSVKRKKKPVKSEHQKEGVKDAGSDGHATANGTQESADGMPKAKRRKRRGGKKAEDISRVTTASATLQDVTV